MSKLNYIVNVEDIVNKVSVKDERDGEYHFIRTAGNTNYDSYREVSMGGAVWYVQVRLLPQAYARWITSGIIDKQMGYGL